MGVAKMVYLHALTPVHAGTGQTVAVIDLPVAREKATGWPVIPASSLKGVLRDATATRDGNEAAMRLFGQQDEAGALCFGDQRLLLFPARSLYGTFAWATCPLALRRLRRDLTALGIAPPYAEVGEDDDALVLRHPEGSRLPRGGKVYLEDLDLKSVADPATERLARSMAEILFDDEEERAGFVSRFALVSDEVFSFLAETATEVVARVRLEESTKTVAQGGLWYEESVPAEAVFAGPVVVSEHTVRAGGADEALAAVSGSVIQIGGKSTVGRGLCRMVAR